MDGFQKGVGGDALVWVGQFVTKKDFPNPGRVRLGAENRSGKPVI